MGITGLIPFLEKASAKVHLKDLRGSTVAVDTYCWLHKGVFSCAEKLVRGEETDQYIQYCLKYVQMLLSYEIKPILVFDGQHLPAKALTEKRRRENRQQSKKRAAELLRLGRVDEARSQMRRCVDVTHEMALRLIRECHTRNIDCIVAPYEADAQMAWLNKVDIAQYIITEDSDLTLFGARKIIFKLDLTGTGLLIEADKLYLAMGCREEKYNFDKFRRMCILSGCDYLDSLPGIGLAKACKFILKTEQENMWIGLKKIPQYLNMRNLEVTDEYIENFLKAEATFKHMYIYNPIERRMERLNPLSEYGTEERYCSNAGTLLEDSEQALNLALGNLNPFTLKQLDNWHPDQLSEPPPKHIKRSKHKSIWKSNYTMQCQPEEKRNQKDNCAIVFKKVDFDSTIIDNEIEAVKQADNAKPAEAEVFSMYNFSVKRKRSGSTSSSTEGNRTPPPSPAQNCAKSRHNPFARNSLHRSPVICENASLLRVLSPKKETTLTPAADIPESRLKTLKRSIFATDNVSKVEVRSRFFANNVKNLKPKEQLSQTRSVDISNEIDEIEKKVEDVQKLQAQLYSPPTLTKKSQDSKLVYANVSNTDSGLESMGSELSLKSCETPEQNCKDDSITSILISDESDSELPTLSQTSTTSSTGSNSNLENKEIIKQQNMPRLGLSKSRPKLIGKKSATKNTKIGNTNNVDQNQTRLSMFGFQKRPVLK